MSTVRQLRCDGCAERFDLERISTEADHADVGPGAKVVAVPSELTCAHWRHVRLFRKRRYKDPQIQEVSVRFLGGKAIFLNEVRLVAVGGGNDVVNPFNVTRCT
jgi:hypothetical protein